MHPDDVCSENASLKPRAERFLNVPHACYVQSVSLLQMSFFSRGLAEWKCRRTHLRNKDYDYTLETPGKKTRKTDLREAQKWKTKAGNFDTPYGVTG